MSEIDPAIFELLSHKATGDAYDAAVSRVVDIASRFQTAFEVDVDGTLAPFTDDPTKSRPRPAVVEGLKALREATPYIEILSGRDAGYFETKLPQWGLAGISVAALYGSQLITWDGDVPNYEPSKQALDGEARVNHILIPLTAELEKRDIKVSASAKHGALTIEFKSHMINFQMANLSADKRAQVADAFKSESVQNALEQNGLWLLKHESGSIEVMSIKADKEELSVDRQRRRGARRFVFFCDDTGDVTLAQRIRKEQIGVVVAVYNAPDHSGRKGTPKSILEAADVVMVGGEVAKQLGFADADKHSLPQDRAGEFMLEVAGQMTLKPPFGHADLEQKQTL